MFPLCLSVYVLGHGVEDAAGAVLLFGVSLLIDLVS